MGCTTSRVEFDIATATNIYKRFLVFFNLIRHERLEAGCVIFCKDARIELVFTNISKEEICDYFPDSVDRKVLYKELLWFSQDKLGEVVATLNMRSLTDIKQIGNNFCYTFSCMKELDFTGLQNVETVGDRFCSGLYKLKTIRFADSFKKLESVGDDFFTDLYGLEEKSSDNSLDLSNFSNLKKIGKNFFYSLGNNVHKLKNWNWCQNLEEIGAGFLKSTSLEDLQEGARTLFSFGKISRVPDSFFEYSKILKHFDTSTSSSSSSTTHVAAAAATSATSNENNNNEPFMTQQQQQNGFLFVTEIGDNFLAECGALTSVDFSGFVNVKKIGGGFMKNCCMFCDWDREKKLGIRNIDFSPFSNSLKEIGDEFMSGVRTIRKVDFSHFKNVEKIGAKFFSHTNLDTSYIDVTPLASVCEIDEATMFEGYDEEEVQTPLVSQLRQARAK